jgi:hypothetical protein
LKIGILTFHRCINYGSYWQTRCLAEELQKRGHDAVILDHYSKRVNIAEWKCALQPTLPTPVPSSDFPFYRKKIEKFYEVFDNLPLSTPFPLEHPSFMEQFDTVIVGSDEVWNLSHPWYGYYPIFYGEGIRARHLISYAASFGNYDVSWKPDKQWVSKLQKFECISVRDENSRTIIKNTLGTEPQMVLDPCLQYPVKAEFRYLPFNELYIAVYGHNFSPFFIHNVRKWAKSQKLPLISIGYRNDWADQQWLIADPLEFANFMARSQAVVSNFFHGCVFALINSKPFITETTPYRSHKVHDLMKKAGAQEHIVTEGTPYSVYHTLLSSPIDEQIYKNIANYRRTSSIWLNDALEQTQHYPNNYFSDSVENVKVEASHIHP